MFQLIKVDQNYKDTKAYLCKENNLNTAINHEFVFYLDLCLYIVCFIKSRIILKLSVF